MSAGRTITLTLAACFTALVIGAILAGPGLQRRFFYPAPPALPAAVAERAGVLLARLQMTLEAKAPAVARQLQPGLTEAEIHALEARGGFTLSDDLRALYRWHNGQAADNPNGVLPGQRFLPLEIVVRERLLLRQQVAEAGWAQRMAFAVFAGHRRPWVQILDDGSSDGYFFDPERTGTGGAFFYSFSEVRHFTWFPSLGNFLTGLIACYESGAVRVAPDGKSLDEDPARTRVIWERLSAAREI